MFTRSRNDSLLVLAIPLRKRMPLDNPSGSRLEQRLCREIRGEVLFDAFSRGRYATDASIYQIEPLGVVVPRRDRKSVV